jgi:threonine dehydrogenase-like Zn-dependent dehydrogenase
VRRQRGHRAQCANRICGSDIFAFQKHGPESRIWIDEEFGHQAISEVIELGKERTGIEVGDRVCVNQDKTMRDPQRGRLRFPLQKDAHLLSLIRPSAYF